MKFDLTPTMLEIVTALQCPVYIVGGAVRDVILGLKPKDIDFACELTPDEMETRLASLKLTLIPDKKARQHGIIRVVDRTTGELIDVATFRKDVSCDGRHAVVEFTKSLEADLARRDFTFNALAVEVRGDGTVIQLFDPFGGK